jgi:serine/threonine protein kinase
MASDFVGRRLGQYQIVQQIGRGGMAVVYKAYQPALERHVAIKVLPRELTFDQAFVERFQREARAAARLNHPHIVTVHDVGQADGAHFIVMELVDGPSLTDLLRQRGALSPEQAAQVVSQTASALDYAHQYGFIHRDIKPGNILLAADGTAKLTDFGIVKPSEGPRLTQTGTLLGTPAYMSPEQARGTAIGPGTDIYSLGVVTYEMLSGRVPFSGPTMAVLHAHVYDPPDLTVLPGGVQPVVGKALAKDPGARYGSAGAFAQALLRALAGRAAAVAPPPAPSPQPSRERRGRTVPVFAWVVGVVGVALVLGVGIAVGILTGSRGEPSLPPGTRISPTPPPTYTAVPGTATPSPPSPSSPTPGEQPSPTPFTSPTPFSTPTRDLTMRQRSIGWSVQGRELSLAAIGEPADHAVMVVGSIQGDQPNTRDLVVSLSNHFEGNPDQVPKEVALYFLPSLNPDGNAANSRFNANEVDLNRNWDTVDWRSTAAVPGYAEGKPGAGGTRPFSEPETAAAADFISELRRQGQNVLVVVFHSSVRRSTGEVYPGGDASLETAYRYASTAGYDVQGQWAEYTTSGEMITWCAEEGVPAIDIVIPGSQQPSSQVPGANRTLQALTVEALLDVAASLGQ